MDEKSQIKERLRSSVAISAETLEALDFLLPLSADYPGIEAWFLRKVVPGLQDGTRYLLRVERDGRLVGLGIAKADGIERKICTVRVSPDYAGRGIGVRVFDGLLKWLGTDQPHLTVSENKLPAFERIFDWYGFRYSSRKSGLYVPSKAEILYNDPPSSSLIRPNHSLII
ncbi:GNAT superfamily N-acetyltransferase [Methylobacterium sp. RAS18]|nr:GNAT superfamily N-acetyltransferase [Methylobacterium sp. RAS18]